MNPNPWSAGRKEWVGRVTLTLIVACGALTTMLSVSNAITATDRIDRIDHAVATLSSFVENSHASIRERIAAGESLDDSITAFEAGTERRLGMVQATLKQPEGVTRWTGRLIDVLDMRRIAQDRKAYVSAAEAAASNEGDRTTALRKSDLLAQKLVLTIEAARDAVEPLRAAARSDATAMVTLALGVSTLVIAYLVWLPVFDDTDLRVKG
jgi:hypothetical protein